MSNVPAIAGGVAVGILAGVAAERLSQANLNQRDAEAERFNNENQSWINAANEHFSTEITGDRQRSRELDAAIEDYRIQNPAPEGLQFGRTAAWTSDFEAKDPDRQGFWFATAAAAAVVAATGAGIAGTTTLSAGARARGVGIMTAGVAALGAALISNVVV